MWCIGDGTATLPSGYPSGSVSWGNNSLLTWDNPAGGELGNQGLTTSFDATDPNDVYAIYNDFWNSTTSTSSVGYSSGDSCELFYYNTTSPGKYSPGQYTITFDPAPPASIAEEAAWATTNPKSFPWYGNNPYSSSITDGGPTRYMSEFKGCQWDNNSCTTGSAVLYSNSPNPTSTDWNIFPQRLSAVTSIPSTWNIEFNSTYGNPGAADGSQIWDASYDIFFDTTGQTGTGIAPYGPVRGQDDGLEIMVWMNSNSSYIDAPGSLPNQTDPAGYEYGWAQPSGWPRETVQINGIVYDVWTSRLNNPDFGYSGGTVVPGTAKATAPGYEPYECSTLPAKVCGTEWNVVSFVAQEGYRQNAMSLDAKVFTDYILGIEDGLWNILTQANPTQDRITGTGFDDNTVGVLGCPNSSMGNQQAEPMVNPIACLNPSWFLMSVQTGFETWKGGAGLQSDSFQAHVYTTSTAVQSGLSNGMNEPVVFWNAPFEVEYTGCSSYNSADIASFTITGTNAATGQEETEGPYAMTQNTTSGIFTYEIPAQYPIHGKATINFTSSCEANPTPLTIFIDPSGQVFYSDGKTPASGATATLLYSTSGTAKGPFQAVPNHNYGLTSPIMQPDDNTLNAMPTTQFGSYAWDVAPGYYEVSAAMAGCGTVTSPAQHVTTIPIENLDLVLTCAPPVPKPLPPSIPSTPTALTATAVSSSQINLAWSAVPLPKNATSVTYTVYELYPPTNVIVVVASGITATNYQVTGLKPSTTYTFAVAAVDASGASAESASASATTLGGSGNCHVTYTVTSAVPGVSNGLTANINIQNTGKTAIYPWTLAWTFAGNQKISYAWNTSESQSGEKVSLSSIASWESIPAGGTLTGAIGFNGNYTGTNTNPTAFTLNGQPCN
jgi:hypothetical protein